MNKNIIMNNLNARQKLIFRIITSPIVFIYLTSSTFIASIFLYPIAILISISGFISFPFIYLLKLNRINIKYIFEDGKFHNSYCFLGYSLLLIFPILWIIIGMCMFIEKGKILGFSE